MVLAAYPERFADGLRLELLIFLRPAVGMIVVVQRDGRALSALETDVILPVKSGITIAPIPHLDVFA
jgi:hypothetical protein